jgi:hypothetical protein
LTKVGNMQPSLIDSFFLSLKGEPPNIGVCKFLITH